MTLSPHPTSGPLRGLTVVEMAGIGPAPLCATLLSDLGASIIRIDRKTKADLGVATDPRLNLLSRGRRSIALDLKSPAATDVVRKLVAKSSVLIEGFRPGVMERLGLGPEVCLADNPSLIYGRMTGWGQTGPLAQVPGHDINYIALNGILHAIGNPDGPPVPPLNLVGDFGGGALYLALGILAAVIECGHSGKGQVIDAAMVDGSASLLTGIFSLLHSGKWSMRRGDNILDGAAPFYSVYETLDGKYISLGPIEQKFYERLLGLLGLGDISSATRLDKASWPEAKRRIAAVIKTKSRDEWDKILQNEAVCYAPVLSLSEAPFHPHNRVRETFVEIDGTLQPAPAPRFSRTPGQIQGPPPAPGAHTEEILVELGFTATQMSEMRAAGAFD